MKKILTLFTAAVLLLSLYSCSGKVNKKIIDNNSSSSSQESSIISPAPQGSGNSQEDNGTWDTPSAGNDSTASGNTDSSSVSSSDTSLPPDINNIPSSLDNTKISAWMPQTNKTHRTPVINNKFKTYLDKYDGYFTGDSSTKVIYLTFDEGYENGYTATILDILKSNGVKAAFFVTKPYIMKDKALIKRMAEEGHIVGNHTSTHPSLPTVSNERLIKEIQDTADCYKEVTGLDMPKFIRPPMGEWSERTLYVTDALGYKTILWSMAYKDWLTDQQPGRDAAYNYVNTYYHNGAILLLHAVSKSNTEALDDIIKNLKGLGYSFAPLTELP